MSPKREVAAPPKIEGYTFLDHLGAGGFADVYLYEQDRPRRKVAIKVLLADLKSDGARRRFESEANLMAQLSTHPYIVTIYEADVTASGHSYLAMEYCSRPNLDVRMRRDRFSVDEALTVGIQVASAVETAHNAGIAHRDIKPANILVTDYNRPALTDFGISGTTDSVGDDEAGMSIPWSPPEVFKGYVADGVKVDVWALGATIYTLLAGHSPFVVSGADNSPRELMSRIATLPLPSLGRVDVPQSLELVLATAMSKAPASRYPSAHALALALQRIQTELNLSVTRFEALDDRLDSHRVDDSPEEATRVRGVVSIDPGSPVRPAVPTAAPSVADPELFLSGASSIRQKPAEVPDLDMTIRPVVKSPVGSVPGGLPRRFAEAPVDDTRLRQSATEAEPEGTLARRRQPRWLLACAGGVLVAAGVAGVLIVGNNANTVNPAAARVPSEKPADALAVGASVPSPAKLSGVKSASGVTFTWENPNPLSGDVYVWRTVSVMADGEYKSSTAATVTVAAGQPGPTCIEVLIRRSNGQASSEPAKACVP